MQLWVLAIILINVLITWSGFNNPGVFDRWIFQVRRVQQGEWYRMITSAFLHVNWPHLLFNMLTLYFFAGNVMKETGLLGFAAIYMGSLLGGNMLALFLNRNHPEYRAVGASGAVSGAVFAAIALFPGMKLALLFLPIPMPAWVFGLGFMLYSIYGIRSRRDNIGHEAHLGGAIIGLLIAILLDPTIAARNALTILILIVPAAVFLVIMIVKPHLLNTVQGNYTTNQDVDDRYRERKFQERQELNRILEKIGEEGYENLTTREKDFLRRHENN